VHSKITTVLTRIARIAILVLASVVVLLAAFGTEVLFFYTSDLPDIQAMNSFAPEAPMNIADAYICDKKVEVVAIPTSQMASVRNALFAAEGDVDLRNIIRRLYDDFFGDLAERKHYGTYSLQLSRQLFCKDHRSMRKRELAELRTSVQLERHFTTNQLLDIYLNRAYFGSGVYGIENAADHYLAKPANQLSTPEAALLVGLIRNPFSPLAHPDRALGRRNEVIDAMARRGSISSEQAEQAKRMPLGTVADDSAKPRS
jgi:membrane carboxypeptidase/penicillin-binding protein